MMQPVDIEHNDFIIILKVNIPMSTKGSLSARGGYILVMRNEKNMELETGKLGKLQFRKGYYVYVGSGMGGVYERIKRHSSKDKKKRWHIDYLTPDYMNIKKIYVVRSEKRIEELLAYKIEKISCGGVKGFGASDSSLPSHLFFFSSPPHHMKAFIDIVSDLNAEEANLH
jgi:sugar fermentation stimulation protein A